MKTDVYYDIVIVDSGVNIYDRKYDGRDIAGIGFIEQDGVCKPCNDYCDLIGHGTAIFDLIDKNTCGARICNIRVFDSEMSVDENCLEGALEYIFENIRCKIINLSLGLCSCKNYNRLKKICEKITSRNVIIVAAFDNNGAISFPAAFDCVIGVDSNYQCKSPLDWEFVENSPINIRAKGGLQRLRWKDEKTIITGGSSFACAYVSAYIFQLTQEFGVQITRDEVLNNIKANSKRVYSTNNSLAQHTNFGLPFPVKRVAIFPFNKESHQFVRFANKLSFEIAAIYDVRYSGRVGMHTNKILVSSEADVGNDYIIRDIDSIDFTECDTLILGHLDEINRMLGYDARKSIIEKALACGINIYSFDYINKFENTAEVPAYNSQLFSPFIKQEDVPCNTFNKLYEISKPVLGIWGTSSSQGKFTLQLILRSLFLKAGYSVGAIGTEPHALLFGMDYVFPMGYASAIYIDDWQTITLLNKVIFQLDDRDIIITSSQANTIPMNMSNLSLYPIRQHSFLLGTNPDIVILCVNPDDEAEYIMNTIKYIEGIINCKVIGLVVYPMKQLSDWRNVFGSKVKIQDSEYLLISSELKQRTGLPVFQLGVQKDMYDLFMHILDWLS